MDRKSTPRMTDLGRKRSFDACARVVRHSALHGEALVGTKREGHERLAGRLILGGCEEGRKGPLVGNGCISAHRDLVEEITGESAPPHGRRGVCQGPWRVKRESWMVSLGNLVHLVCVVERDRPDEPVRPVSLGYPADKTF